MTDLSKDLRHQLAQAIPFSSVSVTKETVDGHTQKALLKLNDDHLIETVLMDYDQWLTACVSTQVGCPNGCIFCATGKMGLKRNLTAMEIVDQINYWNQKLFPKYIGRVVFMGMGEPFANWDNLLAAIDIINDSDKLNIGSRKISISTSGLISYIKKFTQLDSQVNLAISLHSAVQETRQYLMPIAKTNPLDQLLQACLDYVNHTKRQLFFEYALIKDVNDTDDQIQKLIKFIKTHSLFYLNLIPLNPTPGGMDPTGSARIKAICQILDKNYVQYSLRRSFGSSINAACGQLATNNA
jgi:23S rRNA (adenine2503-C2)-methyltransferase